MKGREGNRVCRKDKEGTRESRSSIKEDSGENEAISR